MLRAHPSAPPLLLEGEKLTRRRCGYRSRPGGPARRRVRAGQAGEIARSALWTGMTLVMSEPGYKPKLSAEERTEGAAQPDPARDAAAAPTRAWSRAPRR